MSDETAHAEPNDSTTATTTPEPPAPAADTEPKTAAHILAYRETLEAMHVAERAVADSISSEGLR